MHHVRHRIGWKYEEHDIGDDDMRVTVQVAWSLKCINHRWPCFDQ